MHAVLSCKWKVLPSYDIFSPPVNASSNMKLERMAVRMSVVSSQSRSRRYASSGLAALLLVTGCGDPAPQGPPPPSSVSVMTVAEAPFERVIEMPGRLQAIRTADIRARVDGVVERRVYTEGSDVAAGALLFEIDPRPFQARVQEAEAALARAEATAANAKQDIDRYEGLVARRAISQQEYDQATARYRTATADIAAARAQLETARLNLSYARVTAPIAGRAGRALVTEGALVSAAEGTLLTQIEQLDPIFVNFSESSGELAALRQARGGLRTVPVRLLLEDGTVYPHEGHLNFLDLSIDEGTGTRALRAEFPNPDRALLPGQFVRVQVVLEQQEAAITVPQRAVTMTSDGAIVMVVGAGDTARARPVTLGVQQGDQWQVLDGLAVGDRVVLQGLQKIGPGAPVRVVE